MSDKKKRPERYMKFLVYLIVIVLLNVAGMTLFFRWDLTTNKMYSISEVSKEAVSTLSEPLTINVFFTKNLPPPHNGTERYLRDLLEEYALHGNRYFNYRLYNVSPEGGDLSKKAKENQALARDYGIHAVQIQAIEKDEVKFQRAYMGLVLIHGDLMERIPQIASTDGLEYNLTMAIRKLNNKISALLAMDDLVRVKLFYSSTLDQVAPIMGLEKLRELPEIIEKTVQNLNKKNYGKLKFEYINPNADEEIEAASKEYGVMALNWPTMAKVKVEAGRGAVGLVIEHGNEHVTLQMIRVLRLPLIGTQYQLVDIGDLENQINNNLESLIKINEGIGYLADHGTLKMSPSSRSIPSGQDPRGALSTFQGLIAQSYDIEEVSLDEGGIPDHLQSLLIAGPTEPFSDYDLYQIDQFLMQGKSLALFVDRFRDNIPQGQNPMAQFQAPTHIPFDTGLEKLLAHYGLRIKPSFILDEHCFKQRVSNQMGGGERPFYFIPIIDQEDINNELPIMRNIKGLVAVKVSPLELIEGRTQDASTQGSVLFSSSKTSWETSGKINLNPLMMRPPPPDVERQSFPIAYMLEGAFNSFFTGKPIPEKSVKEKPQEKAGENTKEADPDLAKIEHKEKFLSNGRPGKIFVIASSDMVRDNILDTGGRNPNTLLLLNVIDYLNQREGIAVMRSKVQRFNPLLSTGGSVKTFVKSLNIIGLPILVALFGLLVWALRHARKKRIRMMFYR